MRVITTLRSSILYAERVGDEWRMQNQQGEVLYSVDNDKFEQIYEIIGEDHGGTWDEERAVIRQTYTGNRG